MSADGRVLGGPTEPTGLFLLPHGGCEQDPDEWWRAVAAAARRVTRSHPDEASRIVAVGVTAQWSGTVPVGADLRPLSRAIIWLDHRGAGQVRRVIRGPIRVYGYGIGKALRWIRLTGGAPPKAGKDPIAHMMWLRDERPDIYERTRVFLEPKDYLNLVLTGRAVATFDSVALYWLTDNRNLDGIHYDRGLVRLSGLDPGKLPELVRATDVVGPLLPGPAHDLGIPAGIPVVGGTPDVHSAALGAGAVRDYAAHLYLGTSSWLSCHVPFKKTDVARNLGSLPSPLPGRYLVIGTQESAGVCLEYLGRLLLPERDRSAALAELNAAALRAPAGSGGLIFTPWLQGERAPVEDASLRGGFFNQSLDTSRDEVIRSVFEGVALNTRWLLEAVEHFTRKRLDPLVIVGGGAQSDLWCRIHADVLGRTVRRTADPIQVNVRGAGLLALAALGRLGLDDIADRVPLADTFNPDLGPAGTYDPAYATFRRVHRAVRRVYARLRPA